MLKALLKKQFLELNSFYYQDRKTGKNRSKGKTLIFVLLFVFLFASLASAFGGLGFTLAKPLHDAGLSWLYFSLVSILSLFLGVFGSVFNTYASLYKAKDNDFLLSMPIKPSYILSVRLVGVLAMGILYESLIYIPAVAVFFFQNGGGASEIISTVFLFFIIAVLILVFTCLLGWAVAAISSKVKNKSFITVISSLAFFALYYFFYFKMTTFIQNFTQFSEEIASGVRRYAYPVFMAGSAATGDFSSLFILCAATIILLALTYFVLSKSFISISTRESSSAVRRKKQKAVQTSLTRALYMKEMRRFISSPTYMLNCGLGIILLPAAAAALLIKRSAALEFLATVGSEMPDIISAVPLIVCAAVCILASMIDITAPSVSLEGKNIWILQSMPVYTTKVLGAKRNLHLSLSIPPVVITSVILHSALGSGVLFTVLGTVFSAVFVEFLAAFGLLLNLKAPNLTWQNEAVPVKQSVSVFIALFGGWFFAMLLAGGYFLLRNVLSPVIYIILCIALVGLLAFLLEIWIKKKGSEIFKKL